MSQQSLIYLYIVFFVITFFLFAIQRTALLIARSLGEYQLSKAMLPRWFPIAWIFILGKYVIAFMIGYEYNVLYAIGLVVSDYVLSVILPMPHRTIAKMFSWTA
jgi:hypothetical protein